MALGDPYIDVATFKASVYFKDLDAFFDDDTQIHNFLLNITYLIDGYCKTSFWNGTITEDFVGNGKTKKMLRNYPILTVNSLTFNTLFGGASSGVISNDNYAINRSGLLQVGNGYYFDPNYRYFINYGCGYEGVPEDIKIATMMWAKIMADSVDTGNLALPEGATLTSFKYGKFMETYATGVTKTGAPQYKYDNVPQSIQGILRKYRKGGR